MASQLARDAGRRCLALRFISTTGEGSRFNTSPDSEESATGGSDTETAERAAKAAPLCRAATGSCGSVQACEGRSGASGDGLGLLTVRQVRDRAGFELQVLRSS